jgi:hypothetical protein
MEFAIIFSSTTCASYTWYLVNICPAVLEMHLLTVDNKRWPSGIMLHIWVQEQVKKYSQIIRSARECKSRLDCIFNFEMILSHNLINQRPIWDIHVPLIIPALLWVNNKDSYKNVTWNNNISLQGPCVFLSKNWYDNALSQVWLKSAYWL